MVLREEREKKRKKDLYQNTAHPSIQIETTSSNSSTYSFTAAKTSLILLVSVAWVRWGYILNRARFVWVNLHRTYFAALLMSAPPLYSGKYLAKGCRGIFNLKMSILLRKRMIDVRRNHPEKIKRNRFEKSVGCLDLEVLKSPNEIRRYRSLWRVECSIKDSSKLYSLLLTTLSKSTKLSAIRFCPLSSNKTWSYSLKATQKMILVTASKQWIHFFLSDLCPPTSKRWIDNCPMLNLVSEIPVVLERALRTSFSFGM